MSTQLPPQQLPPAFGESEQGWPSRPPAQLGERHAAAGTWALSRPDPGWVQTSPAGQPPAWQGALHWFPAHCAPWAQTTPQPPQFWGSWSATQPEAQQEPIPPSPPGAWQLAP